MTQTSPEQMAAKVVFDALRSLDRNINPMDIRVTNETTVPDVSDTVFGYGHVRIGLGPSAQGYRDQLIRGCNAKIDRPTTSAPDGNGLWFHGPLAALAHADAAALSEFMANDRPQHLPYRGI